MLICQKLTWLPTHQPQMLKFASCLFPIEISLILIPIKFLISVLTI